MAEIDAIIRSIVRDEIAKLQPGSTDPELVTVKEFIERHPAISRETCDNLVHGSPANGFPAVRMSERVVLIDVGRFSQWAASGGLRKLRIAA
jgi:hypothetical protein